MKRDETLDTAEHLINGARQQTYGSARDDFTRTGQLWAQVLGVPVAPEQVAICMALLKIGRLCTTPNHEDSWVDAIGYMALGSEIATEPSNPFQAPVKTCPMKTWADGSTSEQHRGHGCSADPDFNQWAR